MIILLFNIQNTKTLIIVFRHKYMLNFFSNICSMVFFWVFNETYCVECLMQLIAFLCWWGSLVTSLMTISLISHSQYTQYHLRWPVFGEMSLSLDQRQWSVWDLASQWPTAPSLISPAEVINFLKFPPESSPSFTVICQHYHHTHHCACQWQTMRTVFRVVRQGEIRCIPLSSFWFATVTQGLHRVSEGDWRPCICHESVVKVSQKVKYWMTQPSYLEKGYTHS